MRTLAAVIVYNRWENLKKWLRAWDNAQHPDTQLVVVHNYDGQPPRARERELFQAFKPDYYYPRPNKGMDVGAFQSLVNLRRQRHDHVLSRWDVLYWGTDDALPMRRDFLQHFTRPFEDPKVGLVCNYLVPAHFYPGVAEHVRTVSFAVRAEVTARLRFPPRLRNKHDCWDFEYGTHNLLKQVRGMGYHVRVADPDGNPPRNKAWFTCNGLVWDCGEINPGIHWDRRRRQDHWPAYEGQFVAPLPGTGDGR